MNKFTNSEIESTTRERGDDWEVCPEGTLQSLTQRWRRRRTIKRAAVLIPLTAMLLCALTFSGLIPLSNGTGSGPLVCDQVVKLLPAYASNSLSSTERERVRKHLDKCPFCRAKLQAIQADQSIAFQIRDARKGNLSWLF